MTIVVKVIFCNDKIHAMEKRTQPLRELLGITENFRFLPYWKDERCAVGEMTAEIREPDFAAIKTTVEDIAGVQTAQTWETSGSWECVCGTTIDEMVSGNDTVFVSCSIWG